MLIVNVVWWKRVIRNITVSDYEDLDTIKISIGNKNKDDLLDLKIYPCFIKQKTWKTRFNLTRGLEGVSFITNADRIRGNTNKIIETLAAPSTNNMAQFPFTKIMLSKKDLSYSRYFPYDIKDEKSSDGEKLKGDLRISIFEIVIEIQGRIRDTQISKFYRGKFCHIVTIHNHENRKYRNSYRVTKCKPKHISTMHWIDFEEISRKTLGKIERQNKDRESNRDEKAEVQTKEDLIKELFNEKEQENYLP